MFSDRSKKGDISEAMFSDNRTLRLIESRKNSEDLEINVTRLSDLAVYEM